MDCYDECNYFSLNSFRIAALIVLILYWINIKVIKFSNNLYLNVK